MIEGSFLKLSLYKDSLMTILLIIKHDCKYGCNFFHFDNMIIWSFSVFWSSEKLKVDSVSLFHIFYFFNINTGNKG